MVRNWLDTYHNLHLYLSSIPITYIVTTRLSEKDEELEALRSSQRELEQTLTLRNDELDILRECMAEVTNVNSSQMDSSDDDETRKQEAINALMDTAKVGNS